MTRFSHIVLNVSDLEESLNFYISALSPLGLSIADRDRGVFARITNGRDLVIVLSQTEEKYKDIYYHRKGVGLNHLALSVITNTIVDDMEVHLNNLGISLLGRGKCNMDYRKGYYSLFFEDPDRIMIEIVCHDNYYFSRDS